LPFSSSSTFVHLHRALDRLGPEVAGIGGIAADLEAEQVVLLVVGERSRVRW
jgi:hypothetical protein